MKKYDPYQITEKIISSNDFLIIQDIDGVCIPLVKDPLKRIIDQNYIESVSRLNGKFAVLTCGEHEGKRGVNRLIEKSLKSNSKPLKEGLYLPGLAACGVELQDRYGNITHPGLTKKEMQFLSFIPKKMEILLDKELSIILPELDVKSRSKFIKVAVCDTRFTPTMNLNELLDYYKYNQSIINELQLMMERVMNELLLESHKSDLKDSFYLHLMPNLGVKSGKELMKYSSENDIGTTDIQFIINGAIKQAGLLVLLNQHIAQKTGIYPFGDNFNVRNAPKSLNELISLCKEKIPESSMPLLVGVGDTVTSNIEESTGNSLRGGSDREFLTLIQELGKAFNKDNQVIFVNSGNEEVYRPSITETNMLGVTDPNDKLKFNAIIYNGPNEYIKWFSNMSSKYLKSS